MTYDVEVPTQRYNTEISREYFKKYRAEADKQSFFSHWSVFKGPDTDMFLKSGLGTVNGSFAALTACLYSNIRHTQGSFTLVGVAAKCFKHGTPWLVAGATYGVTVGMISQYRQKECFWHHAIAGAAAGTMLGSWYKWPALSWWSGGIMAVSAGFMKYWHDNDLFNTPTVRRQRVFNMYRRGWLIDRPDAEGKDDAEIDVSFREYRS